MTETVIEILGSYGIPAAVGAAIVVIVEWLIGFAKKKDTPIQ